MFGYLVIRIVTPLVLVAAVAGCRESSPRRPRTRPADEGPRTPTTSTMPAPPPDTQASGAADVAVTDTTVLDAQRKPSYVQNVKVSVGRLVGICYVPTDGRRVKLPSPKAIDVTKGPYAIRHPQPGEVHYYQQAALKERAWIGYNHVTRRYGVRGAVITVCGVKEGPRPPLERGIFVTYRGHLLAVPESGFDNYFNFFLFTGLKDRVMFRCYDVQPADIVLKSLESGEVICQGKMEAYAGEVRAEDLAAATADSSVEPASVVSPPLRKKEVCVATDKRHPWQKAWLIVVDNPYLAVTGRGAHGMFTIEKLPVGKWTVEVWHPQLNLLQKTYDIVIRKDEVAELGVKFKPPPEIAEQLQGKNAP